MVDEPHIPLSLAEVNAEWLTEVLRYTGLLGHERVVDVDSRVVGEGAGFMGEVVMLYLTFDPESGRAPGSMVLKIPTAGDNRYVGQTLGVYEREIRFYRELRPHLGIRTPDHIHSAMDAVTDPEQTVKMLRLLDRMPMWLIRSALPALNWLSRRATYRYVLLIENLENYRIGDQVGGCTQEEARLVLQAMARMHARFWDSQELADFPWLISMDLSPKPLQMLYLQTLDKFKAAHSRWLTTRHVAVLEWIKVNYFELVAQLGHMPDTLVHGDFRLDNLCFDDARREVVVFDWQTLGRGPAGIDLGYFLSALPDHADIDELIEYYREQLAANGIARSRAHIHWQYEVGLLGVLHRVVPAQFQDMLDLGHERGADLIATWLERAFHKIEKVDLDKLLKPVVR